MERVAFLHGGSVLFQVRLRLLGRVEATQVLFEIAFDAIGCLQCAKVNDALVGEVFVVHVGVAKLVVCEFEVVGLVHVLGLGDVDAELGVLYDLVAFLDISSGCVFLIHKLD